MIAIGTGSMLPADAASAATAAYEQIWIPMPDGAILAARLWLPTAAPAMKSAQPQSRFPAALEWIPYRQSDLTAVGDSVLHGWFAMQGIASLRVDLRGSGNSDGLLTDEYTAQEQDDAVATIAWIAAQPWCNGAVGMIGISWSGFAALQVAARRPPALKAIITCCSTDDRYRDDVHYMGGALLSDGMQWGTGLFAQIARPPDPAHTGPRWREMWQQRLEGLAPPLALWLAHPQYDSYWKHGSVCEDHAAITCPVFAVGGWTDGYSDAILRLMQKLSVPARGLIGPWTHMYPIWGQPGPRIGFLQECLRWWRHWLLGEETGIADEAPLRLWLGRDLVPAATGPSIGGSWITLPHWPIEAPVRSFRLVEGRLLDLPPAAAGPEAAPVRLETPLHCGAAGGEWCPLDGGGNGPEFQADQREDDALSLCYDSPPLQDELELVGLAELTLDLSLEGPAALLAIRLCEVRPDGSSARITFGLHRIIRPVGCAAGERFTRCLAIKGVAYAFAPGRRIRLALSSAYWPMAWPEPIPAGLVLWPSSARLTWPGRPAEAQPDPEPFGPPVQAEPIPHEILQAATHTRVQRRDIVTGRSELESSGNRQTTCLGALTFGGSSDERYSIDGNDPQSARMSISRAQFMHRPGWDIRIETEVDIGYVAGVLEMTSALSAFEAGDKVFERRWRHRFPRAERATGFPSAEGATGGYGDEGDA